MIGRVFELQGKAAYIGTIRTDDGLLFDLKVSDLPGMKSVIRVDSLVSFDVEDTEDGMKIINAELVRA